MTKYFYFSIISISVLLLVYCFLVQAMIAPQIYFTDLTLNKTSFEPGETITGTVSLWNYEQYVIGDLVFNFQVLGDEVNGVPTKMIDNQLDTSIFQLSPDEKTSKSFSYKLPSNLPNGSFVFRIQLSNTRGEEMSWEDRIITIGGENKFLAIGNYWFVKDSLKLSPGGGVDYNAGDIPQVVFDVTNSSNFTITAFPKIITYKRSQGQFLREDKASAIILEPSQKQTIETTLPQLTAPESYLSEVQFYDSEAEESISNSVYFRWIISGQDDAEILFVNPDKDSYKTGEEAKIDIQLTGPAHTYSEDEPLIPAEQGTLEVSLFNQKDELICQGIQAVTLESGQIVVGCLVEKDVNDPKIKTKIVKNDKILDDYEFQVTSKETPSEKTLEKTGFFEQNKKIILSVLILLILIIIIMFYLKNKKGLIGIFVILILLGAGVIFTDDVFAAVEVTGGLCDTTIVFTKPVPNGTYNDGDTINFSGKFRVTSCGDGLFFNKITFFIAEDKEIPLNTVSACSGCLGASSSHYPQSACNCGWCDQVQILEENNPDFKVYKLGTIYPSDVASGAQPYWVEYNQNFVIPDNLGDLGFSSGPVRFYVQYSGTHWASHWHWNITYQPGFININHPPTVSGLYDADIDYCSEGPINNILLWQFNDSDSGDAQSAYQVNITKRNTGQTYDSGKVLSPSSSITAQKINNDMGSNFIWYDSSGLGYSWKTKVWDLRDAESGWANSSFTTPKHQWPTIDFNWSPQEPSKDEDVQFTDQSIVYGGAFEKSWVWNFQDGSPISSILQNPMIKFISQGLKAVTFQVTDSDNYTCSNSKNVFVQEKLPGWKEIFPW